LKRKLPEVSVSPCSEHVQIVHYSCTDILKVTLLICEHSFYPSIHKILYLF